MTMVEWILKIIFNGCMWYLERVQASEASKKALIDFVEIVNRDMGMSIKLRNSYNDQDKRTEDMWREIEEAEKRAEEGVPSGKSADSGHSP
jgi:hypothetical protein